MDYNVFSQTWSGLELDIEPSSGRQKILWLIGRGEGTVNALIASCLEL